jgi:tetratricopeptide (TPR) repeat protein
VKIHPRKEVLEDLLQHPELAAPRLLRHLEFCETCRSRLRCLPLQAPAVSTPVRLIKAVQEEEYDSVFERSWNAALAWSDLLDHERREAPRLLADLLDHTREQREILLRNSRRFRNWGLFELLTEKSLTASLEDPRLGEELGLLALRVADLLRAGSHHYGAGSLEDLRARAWAHVGNARRIQSDLRGADQAFQRAWNCFEKGSGDLFEKAILLDLQASLRRAQRRFDEALGSLRRAVSLFLDLGERHRAGRSLVSMSIVYHTSGRPERGFPLLRQALELIDPRQEPRLLLAACHNLADSLADSSLFLDAQRAYRQARPLYDSFPDARTQNRRWWLKGKIARGLGQVAQAEPLLIAAREGFLAEGIPYETALVTLDLALLYADQERTAELKRLAAEMVPIFASRQIHREALAALAFFQKAVEAEKAGVETVKWVAEYLRKARHAPELQFSEDSVR